MSNFQEFLEEFKNKKLSEKREELKRLEAERDTYEEARSKYYQLTDKIYKLAEHIKEQENSNSLGNLSFRANYVACEYPRMGHSGENGSAEFDTQDLADKLIAILNNTSSYYYAHKVVWSGPGKYIVKPSYKYDHDHEIIYTATFEKDLENEE